MKFKSNKRGILDELKRREKAALEAIGQYVVGEAKTRTPVDTGYLRASNLHRVRDTSVIVGNTAEYSLFVEKGTRHQKAQPYLEPAVVENRGSIERIAEQYLGSD
mgnify:CR=1 FL=1